MLGSVPVLHCGYTFTCALILKLVGIALRDTQDAVFGARMLMLIASRGLTSQVFHLFLDH